MDVPANSTQSFAKTQELHVKLVDKWLFSYKGISAQSPYTSCFGSSYNLTSSNRIQAWVCSAHLNMDSTENLFPGSGFQQNDGFTSNMTAVNTSSLYTSLLSSMMNKTINILMIVVLFITMVSLGCTMEVTKIKDHILKPKGVAIAVLSQYGIMPLTAFCLIKVCTAASVQKNNKICSFTKL
ncbi:hypothetical protein ATANTOWER_012076 [Ataeniobius toweri]|uniref:Uncharacterized protein n=1 Tax=Ataeniobius toweri TaxID=208326 RepID=A0ABU7BWM9_9TELE|nr:hypothetical protein [Ataeniobius toweri]